MTTFLNDDLAPPDGDEQAEAMAYEALVFDLSVVLMRLDGNDGDPHQLVWCGGTVPEPWGDVWQKYEPQAERVLDVIGEGSAREMVEALRATHGMVPAASLHVQEHAQEGERPNIHLLWHEAIKEWGEAVGGPTEYEIFADKLIASLSAPVPADGGIPAGYKLVPMKPTKEMVRAMSAIPATGVIEGERCVGIGGAIDAYEAMLAAAPSVSLPVADCGVEAGETLRAWLESNYPIGPGWNTATDLLLRKAWLDGSRAAPKDSGAPQEGGV